MTLLPTPRASEGAKGGPNQRGSSGDLTLSSVVHLLPTPVAHDDGKSPEAHLAMKQRMPGGPRQQITSLAVLARADFTQPDALLPTPAARDAGRGAGYGDQPGRPLSETVLRLLPTPTARNGDAQRGAPSVDVAEQRYADGRRNLDDAVALLPTPTVADSRSSRNATATRTDPKPTTNAAAWTLSDIAHADRWGEYASAIARWEQVTGRPAPDPTEPGSKGQPRLSPRFVEWMQGLPDGHVTAVVGRNDALRLLGNGIVPQQGAAAFAHLLSVAANLTTGSAA